MLDTYEEPDCAMEAAMVKVILNATDMHDIFFLHRVLLILLLRLFSRFLARRAFGIVQANAYKFLEV